jgi:hypothetical protein
LDQFYNIVYKSTKRHTAFSLKKHRPESLQASEISASEEKKMRNKFLGLARDPHIVFLSRGQLRKEVVLKFTSFQAEITISERKLLSRRHGLL